MGGHRGLVILKHKSWNVWNADNRLKVEEDEAAQAADDEAKEDRRVAKEA